MGTWQKVHGFLPCVFFTYRTGTICLLILWISNSILGKFLSVNPSFQIIQQLGLPLFFPLLTAGGQNGVLFYVLLLKIRVEAGMKLRTWTSAMRFEYVRLNFL